MGQPMLVYNQNPFHCPPHANLVKLFPHALKTSCHGTVLLIQGFLCSKCIICQRIPIRGKKKMLLHNKKSKFKLLWHSIYPEAEPSVLDGTVTGLVVLVWDLWGPYHRKICTMMHTSAESPADRHANVVLIQKKERSPKEPTATAVQQPPSLISTLQRKSSWGSERSWERNRREKLCWEGSKLHRTAFLFSADIMKSLRTKLLEVVLFWSGKSDIWITEEEKCWLSKCRAGSLG